jgi:aryl-alcohol dehydrogenase (NADP+)
MDIIIERRGVRPKAADGTDGFGRHALHPGHGGNAVQDRYWHEAEFKAVEALRLAVADAGIGLTTAAIAWVLANPVITAPIIGASRPEQLADTLAAADLTLDPALKQKLDTLTLEFRRGDSSR